MPWLKNAWYQAGWSADVTIGGKLARTVLEEPLLIFRNEQGDLSALFDRCPHRFAPISTGAVEGSSVRCGYHGLAFDGTGRCTDNPHGAITSALGVRAYPVAEKHDAIWVWMGTAEAADLALIPDLGFIDETPETARIHGYMPTKANYQLITDNILDLSHADYLHPTTLGGMMVSANARTVETDGKVVVEWRAMDCASPPPPFRAQVPPPSNVDIWIQVAWEAPAVMTLGVAATPAGVDRQYVDESYTLHNMTPETATTTHYFFCATRRKKVEDVGFTHFLRGIVEQAFLQEDKPMLEAQQARMGTDDIWKLKPALLSIDKGAILARRALEKRILSEAGA